MKNIRLIVPVILAGLLCIGLLGCGNPSGGGSGPGGASYQGRLVDPYIENATIFVDVNGDGDYDPDITGEMMTTTEGHGPGEIPGSFKFTGTPSIGATIKIMIQGMHLGITYDAQLTRKVDGIGGLNISPFTTMLANGISADAIQEILQEYAAITIDANDVRNDPLSGFNITDPDALGRLRGAICIYCLMQVISNETGVQGGYFDQASIEGTAAFEDGLSEMGAAVRGALPDDLLITINRGIASIDAEIDQSFGGMISPSIPPAKTEDIANTAFVITRWIMQHSISNESLSPDDYFPGVDVLASIETYAQRVGMREYLLRERDHAVFTIPASWAGYSPIPPGTYHYHDLVDYNMIPEPDLSGMVATGEISSSVEGYVINFDTWGIDRVY